MQVGTGQSPGQIISLPSSNFGSSHRMGHANRRQLPRYRTAAPTLVGCRNHLRSSLLAEALLHHPRLSSSDERIGLDQTGWISHSCQPIAHLHQDRPRDEEEIIDSAWASMRHGVFWLCAPFPQPSLRQAAYPQDPHCGFQARCDISTGGRAGARNNAGHSAQLQRRPTSDVRHLLTSQIRPGDCMKKLQQRQYPCFDCNFLTTLPQAGTITRFIPSITGCSDAHPVNDRDLGPTTLF